jgi:hypothetical protein
MYEYDERGECCKSYQLNPPARRKATANWFRSHATGVLKLHNFPCSLQKLERNDNTTESVVMLLITKQKRICRTMCFIYKAKRAVYHKLGFYRMGR